MQDNGNSMSINASNNLNANASMNNNNIPSIPYRIRPWFIFSINVYICNNISYIISKIIQIIITFIDPN